mgnify:CR=1 FL=1
MKKHEFGDYNIPKVVEDADHKHFSVLNVDDILEDVALFQYSNNPYKYNVAWRYMDYDDKVGHRPAGQLSDL